MSHLVGPHIETLKPYEPGKPIDELERELGITDSIKLASNENPLGTSPKALEAMQKAMAQTHIYPDGAAFRLREAIATRFDLPIDHITTGNGSNELLTLAARTFCNPGDTAVISQYSFVAYRVILTAANIPFKTVPVKPGFIQDLDALADACDDTTKILFLANPNNPTGTSSNREDLEDFLKKVPAHIVVVIDEAYVEYATQTPVDALQLRHTRDRLIICRTFSKCYGLGGVRVGFAVAPPILIDYINRIREPFNVNIFGQLGAAAALFDHDFVQRTVTCNNQARTLLENGLETLGLTWTPSQTNFLLVEFPEHHGQPIASAIYQAMLHKGVIVRPTAGYGLPNHLRITLGTPQEIERCLSALKLSLKEVLV